MGLYDRIARLVLLIAVNMENYNEWQVVHHLDDICMVGPARDDSLERLYDRFWNDYKEIGVSLQQPKDATLDMAFGPTMCGSLLGIWFDMVKRQWWISS